MFSAKQKRRRLSLLFVSSVVILFKSCTILSDADPFSLDFMEHFLERRKHKRFALREGVFAGYRPNMGEIVDISRGGILFHYLELVKGAEGRSAFVICSEDGCCLDDFSCQVVSDKMLVNESSLSQIVSRQRRIAFVDLTPEQQSLLDGFIERYKMYECV